MINKGTGLEIFVSEIEKVFATHPVDVSINRKTFLNDGTQLAEFDVIVEGKVGTSQVKLLLECRNRPSEGAAPGSWIEQLVGRRNLHGFDKVIAVSTTGFSSGARELAAAGGIELREVAEDSLESVSEWFALNEFTVIRRRMDLSSVYFGLSGVEEKAVAAHKNAIADGKAKFLTPDGRRVRPKDMFFGVVSSNEQLYQDLEPGQRKSVSILARYDPADRFVLESDSGEAEISEIHFKGELWIEENTQAVTPTVRRYENVTAHELITRTASFSLEVGEHNLELAFHRTPEGEIIVQARPSRSMLPEPPQT